MWIIWVEQRADSLSTCPSYRSDLRDGRLSCQPWNRHQIQDIVNSACFVHRSDVRYFICDILCQFFRGIRCQISDLWYSMFTRCICLVWCLRYLSLEIVSGHPPFLKNRHSTPWSTFLARQKSSSSISAASVSPHPYKVLYPDLTFLMMTLFSKIWFSSLLLVHLSNVIVDSSKSQSPQSVNLCLDFLETQGNCS